MENKLTCGQTAVVFEKEMKELSDDSMKLLNKLMHCYDISLDDIFGAGDITGDQWSVIADGIKLIKKYQKVYNGALDLQRKEAEKLDNIERMLIEINKKLDK